MSNVRERLWTDQELDLYDSTISTLRRIRGAAVHGLQPTGYKEAFFARFGSKKPEVQSDRQKVLNDGLEIALIAGDFLATRIVTDRRNLQTMSLWKNLLEDASKKYGKYPEVNYANTYSSAVAVSMLSKMKATYFDPDYMLSYGLTTENKLGAASVQELLDKDIAVVAPFSGDLLVAAFSRAHLNITAGKTFKLYPAAFSKDLKYSVLPELTSVKEIGIFLDVVQSGRSGLALYNALEQRYPGVKVNPPSTVHTEFIPSEKILQVQKNSQ